MDTGSDSRGEQLRDLKPRAPTRQVAVAAGVAAAAAMGFHRDRDAHRHGGRVYGSGQRAHGLAGRDGHPSDRAARATAGRSLHVVRYLLRA